MTPSVPTSSSQLPDIAPQPGVSLSARSRRRETLATLLTLAAIVLMGLSAIWFRPADRIRDHPPLAEATLAALAGALALGGALRLSRRSLPAAVPTDRTLSPERANRPLALAGFALILIGTELNAQILGLPALANAHAHVQFAIFFAGTIAFALGMGGVRRLSRPRIHWDEVLPVLAILALAFVVRAWESGQTVRGSIDEVHAMQAVRHFWATDGHIELLRMTSTYMSPTMLYAYWQAGTVEWFGRSLFGLRMISAIIGTITVLAGYGLGRALFDKRTALVAALVLATFPPHVQFSRLALAHITDTLFGTMFVMFGARALRWNRRGDWALTGISLALTQYFYEGSRLLFPPLAVCWVILLALTLRGPLAGRFQKHLPGLRVALVSALVLALPFYMTMAATGMPFSTRLPESGVGGSYFSDLFEDGLNPQETQELLLRVTGPFLVYVFQAEPRGEFFSSTDAMVMTVLVPLLLLGAAHTIWRARAMVFILLPWILGASAGNILIASGTFYARYVMVFPALAVLIAIGITATIPLLLPGSAAEGSPEVLRWRRRGGGIALALACVVAAVQTAYYFGPFLRQFNDQFRSAKPYRDAVEAAIRVVEELPNPGRIQIYAIGPHLPDPNVARGVFGFLVDDRYPLQVVDTSLVDAAYVAALPQDRDIVFFLEPGDQHTLRLLRQHFHLIGPTYTLDPYVPVDKAYVMYYAPLAIQIRG